jgi:hypothetical protein
MSPTGTLVKFELRVQVDACIAFLSGGSLYLFRQKAASYGDSGTRWRSR